jgi:hypothetical protein
VVGVLVTAGVLMTGPGIAQAAFTSKAGAQVTASTLNLTVTNDAVSVSCPTNRNDADLKIQLTHPVDKATKHTIAVKASIFGYPIYSYTGELNTGNQWTYRNDVLRYVPYSYEITAYYDVKVSGKIVNTWEGTSLTGSKTC